MGESHSASRVLLVIDDGEALAFQIGESVAHGLNPIGRVSHPSHEFGDDDQRFPSSGTQKGGQTSAD
jgi:hypothetical protein